MPFAYYQRLSPTRQAIYRQSDRISSLPLADPEPLRALVPALASALATTDRRATERACQALADGLVQQLEAPAVQIIVREVRPSGSGGELHGLYEPSEPPYSSRVSLWMRTAQREDVVAFRTFLRTLLHELLHHLDYEILDLEESFHTEGFYKRESSLFQQLMPSHP